MALWGAATVQLFYYYSISSREDEWWLKAQVFIVWALDTIHQAFIVRFAYTNLITEFGNIASIGSMQSTMMDTIILTAFICAIVQVFFVLRIWRFSGHNLAIAGVAVAFVMAQFIVTVVAFAISYRFTNALQIENVFNLQDVADIIVALVDGFIAGTLIYLLHSKRSKFARTDTVIKRLIIYTMSTGLTTGVCVMAMMIFGKLWSDTYIYSLFYLMLPRLYTNSMLATLNVRESLREGLVDGTGNGISITTDVFRTALTV
ncbi:hypothetical protein M0805_002024 [Coniferiporia weirii]|nr:hypothetical protein M0805_002024 [Coniferiporia weirii]